MADRPHADRNRPVRRWWSRSRGVPPEAHAGWKKSLTEEPGRPARILAWAPTADGGLVLLSPAVVSVWREDDWRHHGWHEIERGGWNAETAQLRWQTYDGVRGAVALPDPARVPEVFRERVDASVVFERFVPLGGTGDRGVVVSGRRDLAAGATDLTWHTTLTRGITWRTPGVRELADTALAALRHEYDER
ncbi:hypothetical protein GCM10022204_08610 [Microlunatus aurantiacus]|uniref:Polyketide cyclase / dehydrase and lipid transport n=1 Tax=Microlunatus aurantiacus TaxID=446786 RepID=A0ABP7CUS7_9ACTN